MKNVYILFNLIMIIILFNKINLLTKDKNRILLLTILYLIINYMNRYFTINFYSNQNISYIFLQIINIIILTYLCSQEKEGFFFVISFYIIEIIVSQIQTYMTLYLYYFFPSLTPSSLTFVIAKSTLSDLIFLITLYLVPIISILLFYLLYTKNLITYFNKNICLIINGIFLLLTLSYSYFLSFINDRKPEECFIGLVIIVLWIISNKIIKEKVFLK